MPIAYITYSQFVEMFEPSQDFSSYEEDDMIELEWKSVKCKNPAREAGGWSAFIWKPSSHYEKAYEGKWIRQEYNGSSPFALWWCSIEDDEDYLTDDDECEECGDDCQGTGRITECDEALLLCHTCFEAR